MKTNHLILAITTSLTLAACGGGENQTATQPVEQTGRFLDTFVQGLSYRTNTLSGLTDANGTFRYLPGETITFSIGDIVLGPATPQDILTPLDLVEGANSSSNQKVSNILRFLQSIDVNSNPDDGISISDFSTTQASGQSLDFTLPKAQLEETAGNLFNILTAGRVTALIPEAEARDHFEDSLDKYINVDTNSGELGTLQVSGVEANVLGGIFSPEDGDLSQLSNGSRFTWGSDSGPILEFLSVTTTEITVLDFTSQSVSVQFSFTPIQNQNPTRYAYDNLCTDSSSECPFRVNGNTVTFTNATLDPSFFLPNNVAKAPITLNGTLTVKE